MSREVCQRWGIFIPAKKGCEANDKKVHVNDGDGQTDGIQTTTEEPPGEPGPWQDGFLPEHTIPLHYNLSLFPDFYYDGNTYTGKVDIDILVTKATQYLILHYKMMNITSTSVIDKSSGKHPMGMKSFQKYLKNIDLKHFFCNSNGVFLKYF